MHAAPDTLRGVRLGVVVEATGPDVVVPEVDEAFTRTCDRLAAAGAILDRVSVPAHVELGPVAFAGFVEGIAALLNGGGNGFHWRGRYVPELAAALRSGLTDRPDQLSPQVQVAIILGEWLRQNYRGELYARAQNERARLRQGYSAAFDSVGFLIMPTTPGLPLLIDGSLDISDRVLRGWAVLSNTSPTDMTGQPAITLPIEMARRASDRNDARRSTRIRRSAAVRRPDDREVRWAQDALSRSPSVEETEMGKWV